MLPDQKEFIFDCIVNVTNLSSTNKVPEKLNRNPGRTGNLQKKLKLKVGAPIVVTTNHSKQKYREDGIVNSAGVLFKLFSVTNQLWVQDFN